MADLRVIHLPAAQSSLPAPGPLRLVRRIGAAALMAAALTISAITPRPALALSPATPATKSISTAAATLPIQVQHHFGHGGGGPRVGGFHGGGFRGGGFQGPAFHGGFRGGPAAGPRFYGGGRHVYGGPRVYGAPRFYGRPRYFGARHYGFHRRYYRPRVYGYYGPAYYGSAYYYPAYYGYYRPRVCRVVWTYYGPRRVCHVRHWRHHWHRHWRHHHRHHHHHRHWRVY